ncbi:hypothetical protein Daura_06455 [Dactylosporangium aurantiacum]|uniref:Uncharacterized protein n=2 Tax=Dactylosporangium aurantiacum TaxID=35754 RepID=A0A9Q9MSE3_9ACTN|nr:hypothetical protein Daura_06455 [Dactylosporangium aurantiacum]
MYDGRTAARPSENGNKSRKVNSTAGEISFHLEILAIPGREGEALQAVQARAVRDALLWAIEQQLANSPGEGT